MAQFSTPNDNIQRNHTDRRIESPFNEPAARELPQPSADRVRFLRSFARCYTVLPSLPGPIAAYIAN